MARSTFVLSLVIVALAVSLAWALGGSALRSDSPPIVPTATGEVPSNASSIVHASTELVATWPAPISTIPARYWPEGCDPTNPTLECREHAEFEFSSTYHENEEERARDAERRREHETDLRIDEESQRPAEDRSLEEEDLDRGFPGGDA